MLNRTAPPVPLHDFGPERTRFRDEILHGLQKIYKTLPCKYFYDRRGSELFDEICELEEYYPTRTELAIMEAQAGAMAALLGPSCLVVEYGSGSSTKTRLLLDSLEDPAGYVPIDICREHLLCAAARLARAYPGLEVLPVCADYTGEFHLPSGRRPASRTVVYFPGSTIGNFHPDQAQAFLAHIVRLCGAGGGLLIGVDLKKDPQILEPAYNDRQGVTAEFNRNLLVRINRELGADFRLDQFAHHAFYNPFRGRIEMHLISEAAQTVRIDGAEIEFEEDENILTECSYKYSLAEFARLAAEAGLTVRQVWTDPRHLFSVQYLTPA